MNDPSIVCGRRVYEITLLELKLRGCEIRSLHHDLEEAVRAADRLGRKQPGIPVDVFELLFRLPGKPEYAVAVVGREQWQRTGKVKGRPNPHPGTDALN